MSPWLIYCFTVILFERKWLLKRNLATFLPLKSKLSGKFKCFNAIDESIEMLKNIWVKKFQLKWKILKHFTSPKQRSAWRELFSSPPGKSFQSIRNKHFRTEIHMYIHLYNLLSKGSKNVVLGRLEMVQCKCFFWQQPETYFWLCHGIMLFIMLSQLSFVEWVRFSRNFIVKWVIVFTSFCWVWGVLQKIWN